MLNLKEQHRHGGGIDLKFAGNFYNGFFDANNTKFNTLVLKYRYRESGGTWSDWTNLVLNTDYSYGSGNTYSSTSINLGTEFDYKKKYEFQLSYADKLSSATFTQTVKEGESVFDFGKDSNGNNYFNINGAIYKYGQQYMNELCIYMNQNQGILVSLPDAGLFKMMTFNIIGNGYGSSNPISSHIQGYHFQPLGYLIQCKQHNTSGNLPICKFLIKDNKIALWIPSIGSYTSLIITCFQTYPQVAQLPLTYEFMDTEPDATYKVTCTLTNNIIYDTDIETGRSINGKKEYLRTCTIGAIANTKSVSFAKATGITPKNILKIEGTVFSSDAGASWGLPNQNVECHISSPNVWVTNNTGFNITSGLIYIYFTK